MHGWYQFDVDGNFLNYREDAVLGNESIVYNRYGLSSRLAPTEKKKKKKNKGVLRTERKLRVHAGFVILQ